MKEGEAIVAATIIATAILVHSFFVSQSIRHVGTLNNDRLMSIYSAIITR